MLFNLTINPILNLSLFNFKFNFYLVKYFRSNYCLKVLKGECLLQLKIDHLFISLYLLNSVCLNENLNGQFLPLMIINFLYKKKRCM